MAGTVAVIAGATRGIGFALVRALASAWTTADTVYLTARRAADGEAAVAGLGREGLSVRWLPLDLTEPAGAAALATSVRERRGGLDVAVLNEAYAPRADLPAVAKTGAMIETNNHGSLRFLRDHARLVIVASAWASGSATGCRCRS